VSTAMQFSPRILISFVRDGGTGNRDGAPRSTINA